MSIKVHYSMEYVKNIIWLTNGEYEHFESCASYSQILWCITIFCKFLNILNILVSSKRFFIKKSSTLISPKKTHTQTLNQC
jgi:hypothetical protein